MTIVRTQQELDAALAAGEGWIDIRTEAGAWLTVAASGSATVTETDCGVRLGHTDKSDRE